MYITRERFVKCISRFLRKALCGKHLPLPVRALTAGLIIVPIYTVWYIYRSILDLACAGLKFLRSSRDPRFRFLHRAIWVIVIATSILTFERFMFPITIVGWATLLTQWLRGIIDPETYITGSDYEDGYIEENLRSSIQAED